MKLSNHLIIISTIILGFWIDESLNPLTIILFLELNFGFLIFTYWVFAMPEKLHSSAALSYGIITDLFFSNDSKKIYSKSSSLSPDIRSCFLNLSY